MPNTKKTWLRFLPWAFLLGGFALYAAGAARGLSIMDSGEFLGVAATLGVAHPTGYPLYALLGQLATFFPWGEQAYLINLVSAAAAAGAAFFVALAAGELARQLEWGDISKAVAITAAGLLALAGRTLWSVGTMAEVYALNALLWGALLWLALRLRRTGGARELYMLALAAGLSLANHMTIILFFPALPFIGWPGRERARELARALPLAAAFLLAGASVNLYTPVRAAARPLYNWDNPSTLGALGGHVAGLQYAGRFVYSGAEGAKEAWVQYRGAVLPNVTPAGAFAVVGLAGLFAKGRWAVGLALALYAVGYLAYCVFYTIPDIWYYFIPIHLAVVYTAALGAGFLYQYAVKRRVAWRRVVAAAAAAATLGAAGWAFATNYPYGQRRGFVFAETYGGRLLAALPARALFFTSCDTNTFITWYNVYVRGLRPDVTAVAQIMLTNRGYLTALARHDPYLSAPTEAEVRALAEYAESSGRVENAGVVLSSDDFVLRNVIERIINENAARRPIFWGIGDAGGELRQRIVPYDVVMEVAAPPPLAELAGRGEAGVTALTDLTADVEKRGPAELNDPAFRAIVELFYVGLSNHLLDWGIVEPQEKLYASYVRLFPDDVKGYDYLAGIYMLTGRPEEAADCYRDALELAPRDAVVRARLAGALLAAGRVAEAGAVVDDLAEGSAAETDYVRGLVFRARGEYDRALAAFAAAEEDYGQDAEFWWERGLTYQAAGDHAAAVDAFAAALALEFGFAPAYTARGISYVELAESERARADFEAAVELNAGDAPAHYELARIYATEGRAAAALEHLEAAVRVDPEHYLELAGGDADLAVLRGTPAFERIRAEYGGPPAR